jgi:Phosphotransferase enzyme family
MSNTPVDASLSILGLPAVLTDLFERAQRPLLPGSQGPLGLFVRYLRRKSGRGLAVIYAVDKLNAKVHAHDPKRAVSLTLDEQALDGAHIRFTAAQAHAAPVEVQPSGVLRANTLGISVQAFPADAGLPALAASCDTTPGSPVFEALQRAAQAQLQDPTWHLVSASAEPVRYKPANRCVTRYSLLLEHPQQSGMQKKLTIFGKVYAEPAQARSVQALQQQLYNEQEQSGEAPLLPRPLGMVDTLGLTFNQAVQPEAESTADGRWASLRTGTRALQPQLERGRGGVITQILLPDEELRLTAQALARLHTSTVRPNEAAPRTGGKEAKRARERAALIAGRNAEQAEEVKRLSQQLASRLDALQPDQYRPAHGGFKASQLLFHSHRVFVVDFDGFCLADPALDVGYFLAYLRPSGLWYSRPGMRQWFEGAAAVFRSTYRQAMLARGVAESSVDGILKRSQLYEAALIFKIATRRVNRLNSPRPHELSAMLNEISSCLSGFGL